MIKLSRRQCLFATAALALPACSSMDSYEIIDTHTHFYDPFRPEGVPWPGKNSSLYRKVTASDFVKASKPFGVTGTIVIEASSWIEDNKYLLELAMKHKVIYGVVGHLTPGEDNFKEYLERFSKDSYFKGIRVSSKVLKKLDTQAVRDDFKLLENSSLTVDVNGLGRLEETYKLAKLYPQLRIVIEHISGPGKSPELLRETAKLPNVYGKISSVLKIKENIAQVDLSLYREGLDSLWGMFGANKLMFGSNWPVSDKYNGTYEQVFGVLDEYSQFLSKSEKRMFFGETAKKVYSC
ncbi:MAG: amidohydrolase family protein [Lentisphaeraceae bacterium]|nr:amidohydrolase family protein [Lentisphaeraceae bacterium]